MALLGSDTSVTGPFPEGLLLLETLAGTEALGLPYDFELGLLSESPNLNPDLVLGQPLAVGIKAMFAEWRYFHGIVTSFTKAGITGLHTRYSARLRPRLSVFDETLDCRIFNQPGQTALGIVTSVLADRGLSEIEAGGVKGQPFRRRELCVQYRESDLHFVQRLLEEEGIYYFFRHGKTEHTLVLANANTAHDAAPGYETVPYTPEERHAAGAPQHLWGIQVRKGMYPGRHTVLAGYDPRALRPKQPHFGRMQSDARMPGGQFEHYDHPGGLCHPDEADGEAMLRSQAERVTDTVLEVEGNTVGLGVGNVVKLRPGLGEAVQPFWDADGFGKEYLVIRASYSLSIDQYETGIVVADEPFQAKYWLLDARIPFCPQRTVDKPRMAGPQTALVVGRAGDEIWTDELGRIRVQLDWDRLGKHNENSTCWVRVAELWAGGRWGAMHLPRVGQEVIVRFLDGDPDRPIVAGALYNADNLPPYELPANATQSGSKSRSSKGGAADNFNEIRFEDKKGAEELHVQAERDMSTLVKHCQSLQVGKNRSIVVGHDEDNLVKAERDSTVDGQDSVVVGGDHDQTVNGSVFQVYGGDHSRKVDGEQELVEEQNKDERVQHAFTLTADEKLQLVQAETSVTFKSKNVTVDSAGEITVLAGGATVAIDKTGLTTFDSPSGITLTCGASSLAITPGGVALAAPAVTAAAGDGSVIAMGADQAAVKSRKVIIEAAGVCKIWGHKALKLQEAEKVKGAKVGAGGADRGESQSGTHTDTPTKTGTGQIDDRVKNDSIEIEVVDDDGHPVNLAYALELPDGTIVHGQTGTTGIVVASDFKAGACRLTLPNTDAGRWKVR